MSRAALVLALACAVILGAAIKRGDYANVLLSSIGVVVFAHLVFRDEKK